MENSVVISSSGDRANILEGVLHGLFDCLSDKDVSVRVSAQNSLIKVFDNHTTKAFDILADYRTNHEKISDQTISIILIVIERVINSNTQLGGDVHKKIIALAMDDLIRSSDFIPLIQEPALAVLVAIGRGADCDLVIEALLGQIKEGNSVHFMVMQCFGTLASVNILGTVPHIKTILSLILPTLSGIKLDHFKQSYAYAIGRFSEALLEYSTDKTVAKDSEEKTASSIDTCSTEISVAYDVFFNQWLQSREPVIFSEILQALSLMYPLLPTDKIQDQSSRLIPNILNLYRRSMERTAVTQFLSSVLKTTIELHSNILDTVSDALISSIFDLVCVFPDYEKPKTIKAHYEVLRCFHLISEVYAEKIMEVLLIHLRGNNERDRIKSLLILTHLTNTSKERIENKMHAILDIIKQMIMIEKGIKMKMTLLKTIVALCQKSFVREKEFVWFLVRHSCKYSKINTEHGSIEEHNDFMQSCENSLFMLSSTMGTMDDLLKRELLNYFVLLDYTDICSNLAKCMASLFAKSPDIEFEINNDNSVNSHEEQLVAGASATVGKLSSSKITVPSPETIFSRCLALMGNYHYVKRASNLLTFLKYYYPHLNPELGVLWDKRIPDLLLCINKESYFNATLIDFIRETIEFLNQHDEHFAERLVNKMSDQLFMYPVNVPHNDFVIPILSAERGMLLKSIGLTLCYVQEQQTITSKIDLIITAARQEKLDKHVTHAEYAAKISSASTALGYISRSHFRVLVKKLAELAQIGGRKHSTGFFSNLHFIKDTHKELENYKTNLLVIMAFGNIMDQADPMSTLKDLDDTILNFLIFQLNATKDQTVMSTILKTLLSICNQIIRSKEQFTNPLKYRKQIMEAVFSIPMEAPFNDLPLLPIILKLGTDFIRIGGVEDIETVDGGVIFEIACKNFFTCAQHLKSKFDSDEEDQYNSFLAKHLNESLPELNSLVKAIIEVDPSPSTLDLIISILECWTRDKNSEARICASHVFNNALEVYIKSMKIGCEAPSKFNQTGQMLGKIVPRCIDSNPTVRQVSVEILQKTLEISCIYETLTIADSSVDWIKDIENVKENIITEDPKLIYSLAGNIARIIALRMSNFQYLQFCKTLLSCLRDPEQSSATGASVVLKFFIQQKGSELFHAIPDLVKDSLTAIKNCDNSRAKTEVLKAIVSLTKHHPKLVCLEMLAQSLPYDENLIEYWHIVSCDNALADLILDNFLAMLLSTCPYEQNEASGDRQKIASVQPFAIFCALRQMFPCTEIREVLRKKFAEIFTMLLTSLAIYTNLAPPMLTPAARSASPSIGSQTTTTLSSKSKFGFIPNKESVKLIPCLIVLETFQAFLENLKMEQIGTVLTVYPNVASSSDLKNFTELLTPMAIGIVNEFSIDSSTMKQITASLSRYVSSPYDGQRVAAIGLYARLVPLRPYGDIATIIMLHLNSALSDPNPVIRGLSIQGLGYVGHLTEHDIEKHTEGSITALLKGIDDTNSDCLINIPLESMRGLSRILQALPSDRVESFHVSLAIRIRPFFGSYSVEIREAAIILFGDLCESKMTLADGSQSPNASSSSEALREQLIANFFPLILHLSEAEATIIRACKVTLRKVCLLVDAPKVNEMAQRHLIDHGQLNYNIFIVDFIKLIAIELVDYIQDFIDSCVPQLRSQWTDVRGNAAIVIGLLYNFLSERNHQSDLVGNKISALLKDECKDVRSKAAIGLGYFFGGI